jgi:hypothetical protein
VKTGIQKIFIEMDSRLRGNDIRGDGNDEKNENDTFLSVIPVKTGIQKNI